MALTSLFTFSSVQICLPVRAKLFNHVSVIALILFCSVTSSAHARGVQLFSRTTISTGISEVIVCQPIAIFLFQVDKDLTGQSEPVADGSQNCMVAQERVRYFTDNSWIAAFLLAIALYAIGMVAAPKRVPPSLKWLMAPVLSALIISGLVANFVRYQLIHSCGESSSFRIDTFVMTAVWNAVIVLILFSLWSAFLYHRRNKRLRAAAE